MTRQLLSAVAFLALGITLVSAGGGDGPDPTLKIPGVLDLGPDDFDKVVNGGKHALVEFYAPWCGHCKTLVPQLQKLASLIEADPLVKGRVVIAKVNADSHRELGTRFDVKGFPTLKFMRRGKAVNKENAVDYNSARTAEKFLEYIKEQLEADKGFARVDALNEFALNFAKSADQPGLLKTAAETVAKLTGTDKINGEHYIKFGTKAVEKGYEFISKEKARLDKILSSGSVAASKVEDFSRKSSILGHLLGQE